MGGGVKSVGDSEILERVRRMERAFVEGLRRVEENLRLSQESFRFIDDGLKAYRERILDEIGASARGSSMAAIAALAEQIRLDRELRFPHRKLLDILLSAFDFRRNEFGEIHFSKLVRDARVGKNMAKEYLTLLESKGYLQYRSDGYRTLYKLRR